MKRTLIAIVILMFVVLSLTGFQLKPQLFGVSSNPYQGYYFWSFTSPDPTCIAAGTLWGTLYIDGVNNVYVTFADNPSDVRQADPVSIFNQGMPAAFQLLPGDGIASPAVYAQLLIVSHAQYGTFGPFLKIVTTDAGAHWTVGYSSDHKPLVGTLTRLTSQ